MQASLDSTIREKAGSYLAGKMTLHDFRKWFVGATWEIDDTDDPAARDTADEIEHRFAELSNGDWTEDEFKRLLSRAMEPTTANVDNAARD